MDMPFWFQEVVTSLSELGRVLIVAHNQGALFDYLSHALTQSAPLRAVLDDEREPTGGRSGCADTRERQRVESMLQSLGLSIAE